MGLKRKPAGKKKKKKKGGGKNSIIAVSCELCKDPTCAMSFVMLVHSCSLRISFPSQHLQQLRWNSKEGMRLLVSAHTSHFRLDIKRTSMDWEQRTRAIQRLRKDKEGRMCC